jgi:subtilase family serine protease
LKRALAFLAVLGFAFLAMTFAENTRSVSAVGTAAPVCPGPAAPGTARCHAHVRTDDVGTPGTPQQARGRPDTTTRAAIGNSGAYDPTYLRLAYNITTSGSGTVAIVDAFDDPKAESDLAYYRSFFGLQACTTANGCFKKVNQTGGTLYPRANSGWAAEISLDIQMVSAICPSCHILLVEASSNSINNLAAAVNYAKSQPGVIAVSNSYGASEWSGEVLFDPSYVVKAGVAITASSGDAGYGVEWPAASPSVTAVGGTNLVIPTSPTPSRPANAETVWSGAGSGCSAYESQPSRQFTIPAITSVCSKRVVADVSAVADPNTGVWVYDSYAQYHGWYIFGGTSVASPIIASVYAVAGGGSADTPYANSPSTNLFDIVSGSNGSCGGTLLCTGKSGYDGPSGLGTPKGTGGF